MSKVVGEIYMLQINEIYTKFKSQINIDISLIYHSGGGGAWGFVEDIEIRMIIPLYKEVLISTKNTAEKEDKNNYVFLHCEKEKYMLSFGIFGRLVASGALKQVCEDKMCSSNDYKKYKDHPSGGILW